MQPAVASRWWWKSAGVVPGGMLGGGRNWLVDHLLLRWAEQLVA
jgi:hypothetical protein